MAGRYLEIMQIRFHDRLVVGLRLDSSDAVVKLSFPYHTHPNQPPEREGSRP